MENGEPSANGLLAEFGSVGFKWQTFQPLPTWWSN